MFEEEREMWEKFFGFFKGKFNEDVGILPGAFEDEDIEIDMIIGENSKLVRGIRVFQLLEDDFEDDEGEESDECLETDGDETEEEEEQEEELVDDEEDDDGEDDDGEDDDDEDQGILVYDLIYNPKAKPSGVVAVELDFPESERVEDEESIEEDHHCKACEEGKGEHTHPTEEGPIPEDKIWISMEIYTEDGNVDSEITSAVVTYKKNNQKHVFVETDEFPDL